MTDRAHASRHAANHVAALPTTAAVVAGTAVVATVPAGAAPRPHASQRALGLHQVIHEGRDLGRRQLLHNEPIDGTGDGDTAPDWRITGDLTARLRAERAGTGTGRVYTITVACTDRSGNVGTGVTTVQVPLALPE